MDAAHPPHGIDITVPSPARTYDYLLGGHDHYQVDRDVSDAVVERWPGIVDVVRTVRAWTIGAATYLAAEEGVDQFLDLGSGLPTAENVHQVVQRINPDARVVYVDHDPIVLAHGRYLLAGSPQTDYADADIRDVGKVLAGAARSLDFSRPIAVVCSSVLHYVEGDPVALMGAYAGAVAPGSYLAASLASDDGDPALLQEVIQIWTAGGGGFYPRSRDEINRIFDGHELVPPGVELTERWWRPDVNPAPLDVALYGAIAKL